ncbi:Protein SET DOMAIN GROUP 41 [Linum grandiflorum]
MEMRAGEEVEIGSDVTPAISPISYALHDSFLSSHCSSCFSPLPNPPFLPTGRHRHLSSTSVFYCSDLCSSADSSLRFSSAEFHLLSSSPPSSSADLRCALRLLRSDSFSPSSERMLGLLTNREKLLAEDDEIADRVRIGARAMAAARREETRDGEGLMEEEEALCLVITNGVEVLDSRSRSIGIAVYNCTFSWINHSCSPNSCYRFLFSPPAESPDSAPIIFPSGSKVDTVAAAAGGRMRNVDGGYGPRIVVRSIRRIEKGEEVTVAYTDLLQPKEVRQSELWLKYRFICSCPRCSSSSPSSYYVDHALEEISSSSTQLFDAAQANERLTDYVDEAITTFLSEGDDPEPCCAQLERLLVLGLDQRDTIIRLNPLHHLSLNAYTTLASAYSIRAASSVFDVELRTSAAYAFFLAAAANHLFSFEPSLIVSVSNYWASAGEALLRLVSSTTTSASLACSKCRFKDVGLAVSKADSSRVRNADFTSISFELVDCIRRYARKVWCFLSKGCQFLSRFDDPMDFDSIRKPVCDVNRRLDDDRIRGFEFADREIRTDVWQLGAHCLVYGGFLSAICYGSDHSPWTDQIRHLLDEMLILNSGSTNSRVTT